MTMSFAGAVAAVSAPGAPFHISEASVFGTTRRVFTTVPPNMRFIFDAARAHGDRTFIVYESERSSFADTMASVDGLAYALLHRFGVVKGDRVAIAMRNYPEWIISFAAITSIGAISVSLNSWWTEDELSFALEDSSPKVVIADEQRASLAQATCERIGASVVVARSSAPQEWFHRWEDVVQVGPAMPIVDIAPDDDATILYTSGTTGKPKGAVSTHRAIISALMGFGMRGMVDAFRKDGPPQPGSPIADPATFILIVPLFHVTGAVPVMLGCFIGGSKLVIMYKWDVDRALELIQEERVNNFVGVPTQSWDLILSPRFDEFDTSSLRNVGGGGAPAPAAQVELVAKKVPSGGPGIGYGMTETNAYGPQNNGDDYLTHPNSAGRLMPIMQIEVRDESGAVVTTGERGEIWFNGPMLIRGYWNRAAETAETIVDGWLRSGDVGRVDADGFVYVEDRLKDMILRAGENVYCAEVEAAIYGHPAVHEAAVFGVPHERLGEEVAVAVLPKDGQVLSAEDLRAYLQPKLAGFKIPSRIVLVSKPLPRNAAGKFLKRELRDSLM